MRMLNLSWCKILAQKQQFVAKMSAKLRRNIEAAQRFLEGLKTLSIFQEMRLKQLCSLEANIERLPHLKTEEAGSMISLLDDGIWGTELARLKEAIASKVSSDSRQDSAGRRLNQDFMELPNYLTSDLWDLLRGTTVAESHKVDVLVRHCGKLGLRNPNEGSKAMIVALTHAMHDEPFPDEKLRLIGKYRSRITKGLENFAQPPIHLPQLPADPDQLPESIAAVAFAEQARVAMPCGVPDFQALAVAWPVRNRGKSESVSMPAGQSAQALAAFGHAMHGIMQVGQELRRSSSSSSLGRKLSLLPLEDKKDSQEEEPLIDILPARQKEEKKVTEEVKDALEEALPKRRKKENAAADAESVAETLARLRDGCRKKDKDEEKSKDGKRKAAVKAMKKPAAAGLGRAVGLRDQARDPDDLSAGQSNESGDVASPPLVSEGRKKKVAQPKRMAEQASQGQGCAPSAVAAGTSAGRADKKPSKGRKKSEKEKKKEPKKKKETCASKKSTGNQGTAGAREAKRQKVLALVPEQLKKEYEQGCNKCRGRSFCTVSCWRERGFTLDSE